MNKVKLILVVIAISALFLGGIYLRLEELLFADKLDQMELQIKNQVSSLTLAYQSEAKFLRKWVHTINDEGTKKINWNAMYPYFAVAQLNANLQVVEWSFREKSPVSSMSKENLTQLVNSFNLRGQQNKDIKNVVFTDPDKKKIFLTILSQGERVWMFASLGESYQSIMDTQKTSPFMLTLINSELMSLANIKSEYVGQKIFENKILSEIKVGTKATASGTFAINTGEEFFAYYEKVNDADMYVYSQVSLSELIANKNSVKNQYLIFSLGFLIILTSIMILVNKSDSSSSLPVKSGVNNKLPTPAVVPPAKTPSVGVASATMNSSVASNPAKNTEESSEKVNLENYMKLASVIGNEIQIPILKMLNLTTNMLTQSHNHAETENLKNIQNEIRSTKSIVDKLLVFSGEKTNDKVETKIETPILRALKNLEVQLSLKSVKVEKEFQEVAKVPMDVLKMTSVFENLIKNSIQALERKAGKLISIKVYQKDDRIIVEFSDNGEGIEKDNLKKVFEPFYSTMDHRKNVGLGLSMALGVLKNHGGQIIVESERGKGTKMILEMPLVNKALNIVPVAAVRMAMAEPVTKIDLPQVKEEPPTLKTPAAAVENLKIPVDSIDLMSQMKEASVKAVDDIVIIDDDSEEEFVNKKVLDEEEPVSTGLVKNDDAKLDGFDPDATVVAKLEPLKPLNLNVNVDELFDMNDEPTQTLEPKVAQKPVASADPSGSINIIVPPKSTPRKVIKASEEFKVVIRKPRGSN